MNQNLRVKLQAIADEIVNLVMTKDEAYGSSWKSHGGFSAFFNLDRKYSRLQNMAQQENYDLFSAVLSNDDGRDTLQDLVAYALLTLSETYTPPGYVDPEDDGGFPESPEEDAAHLIETKEMMRKIESDRMNPIGGGSQEDDGAGPDYVNQD